MNNNTPQIAIIMGSQSDWPVMQKSADMLKEFGVEYHAEIVSAHRTPQKMYEFATKAEENGFKVIIAGAGGAAHLPGMVASLTALPVVGVPVKSSNSIEGIDSLFSIVQMPKGVPVATMAINGAQNAGLMALRILGIENTEIRQKMKAFQAQKRKNVEENPNPEKNE